jgi:hypothetical protein
VPWIGNCANPLTIFGAGTPTVSLMIGATSVTWWNCGRSPPLSAIHFGQVTIIGFRVPPKWLANCLVNWNGVSIAQVWPTAYSLLAFGPLISAIFFRMTPGSSRIPFKSSPSRSGRRYRRSV